MVQQTVDANGIQNNSTIDALGRVVKETRRKAGEPNSTATKSEVIRYFCSSSPVTCPANARYLIAQRASHNSDNEDLGAPLVLTFFDSLRRAIRTTKYTHAGPVHTDTEYNSKGQVKRVSEPYAGPSANAWLENEEIDEMNRVRKFTSPDGTEVEINYQQAGTRIKKTIATTFKTPNGSRSTIETEYTNLLGQTSRVYGADDKPIFYTYDEMGNLSKTRIGQDESTSIVVDYDVKGNRTKITDPDAGTIHFVHNGFGELRKQIWAKNTSDEKSISFDYDKLSRKTKRVDERPGFPNSEYSWVWDTRKKGMLSEVQGNGKTESYFFDSLARIRKQNIDIRTLGARSFDFTYDKFNRPLTVQYPSGLKIQLDYHAAGIHARTKDISKAQQKTLWEIGDAQDDRGAFTLSRFGNGAITEHSFNANSGRLEKINTGRFQAGDIQYLEYDYDSIGNLYSRSSRRINSLGIVENLSESFQYDDMNRLIDSNRFSSSGSPCGNDYCYDDLGNLTFKPGVGHLEYQRTGNAGIHAITHGNGKHYDYDVYGNMVRRGSDNLLYDTFNKPIMIKNTFFAYDADHKMYQQNDLDSDVTTWYLGDGLYEEIKTGGKTIKKSYVGNYYVQKIEDAKTEVHYLHRDNLGSVEAISDSSGNFASRMVFDPWGERLEEDWRDGDPTIGMPLHYPTQEGYTGHQQLDQLGLVHMDGRVYDPAVSRFLSADLFVQAPGNSQSYNRYSYVFNNPLSMVDPSGYISVLTTRPLQKFRTSYNEGFGAFNSGIGLSSFNPMIGFAADGGLLTGIGGAPYFVWDDSDDTEDQKESEITWTPTLEQFIRMMRDRYGEDFYILLILEISGTDAEPKANGVAGETDDLLADDRECSNRPCRPRGISEGVLEEPSFLDNPGYHLPSVPHGAMNFFGGMGDGITLGFGASARGYLGFYGGIDPSSTNYGRGEMVGVIASALTTSGGAIVGGRAAAIATTYTFTSSGLNFANGKNYGGTLDAVNGLFGLAVSATPQGRVVSGIANFQTSTTVPLFQE